MLFLPLYNKHLPRLESCSFINLGKISILRPFATVRILKPVQQYDRLETITMDVQQLYLIAKCYTAG